MLIRDRAAATAYLVAFSLIFTAIHIHQSHLPVVQQIKSSMLSVILLCTA